MSHFQPEYKYYHYSQQRNSELRNSSYLSDRGLEPTKIKSFKIKIRKRIIYTVELFYYEDVVFIKFHPKLYESHPDKYQIIDVGLQLSEIKRLMNTCCKIVLNDLNKDDNSDLIYAFFGQWYFKDNQQKRISSKRFCLYEKQVSTFFSIKEFNHFKQKEINYYSVSLKSNQSFDKQNERVLDLLTRDEELVKLFMTETAVKEYL